MEIAELGVVNDLDLVLLHQVFGEDRKELVAPKEVIPQEGDSGPVKICEPWCWPAGLNAAGRPRPDDVVTRFFRVLHLTMMPLQWVASATMSDGFPVDRVRADTPGVETVVHLNNAGSSLPPDVVVDTVIDHLRREASIGGYEARDEAGARIDAVYGSIARLINGRAEQVAIVENATRAWDMAVYGYPFQAGDRVLTGRTEYASNLIALRQLRDRHRLEIVLIEDDDAGQIDLDHLERELSAGAAMVALTHIATSGGLINPAAEVGRLCRAHGVFFVLDACQSIGQVPVDVEAIGCNVLTTTGRKFLRGPRGTGFLWVDGDALDRLTPPLLDLHAAEITDDGYRLVDGARRFENWERYFAGTLGLGAAVDYLLGLGIDATTGRTLALGRSLRAGLEAATGVTVHDKGVDKGAIVTFSMDGVPASEVKERLAAAGINTSVSSGLRARYDLGDRGLDLVIRASVHYYNTVEELEHFFGTIERIRNERS